MTSLMNVVPGNFSSGFATDKIRDIVKKSVDEGGKILPFHMVRDASSLTLEVDLEHTERSSHQVAIITVDGMSHRFSRTSRVSKHLQEMPAKQLEEQLRSGAYFFIEVDGEPKLVDFKLDAAHNFIHTDKEIHGLMNHIGVSDIDRLHRRNRHLHGNTQLESHFLGSPYSADDVTVDILNKMVAGGEFQSVVRFLWSPFNKAINSSFELIRLICVNGMIGTTNFMNTKIPLMNMWEQNLSIANKQIQARIHNKATSRLEQMSRESASVLTLMQIKSHIEKRAADKEVEVEDRNLLVGLKRVVDPTVHLAHVYRPSVFDNAHVAAQQASHLSKMDAWNIVTEMSSHTSEGDDSTTFALSRIANDLMFSDRDFRVKQAIDSPFKSSDHAFFGQQQIA